MLRPFIFAPMALILGLGLMPLTAARAQEAGQGTDLSTLADAIKRVEIPAFKLTRSG